MRNTPSTGTYIVGLVMAVGWFIMLYLGTALWPFTLIVIGLFIIQMIFQAIMEGALTGLWRLGRYLTTGRWKAKSEPEAPEDHGPSWPIPAGSILGAVSGFALALSQGMPL